MTSFQLDPFDINAPVPYTRIETQTHKSSRPPPHTISPACSQSYFRTAIGTAINDQLLLPECREEQQIWWYSMVGSVKRKPENKLTHVSIIFIKPCKS